MAPAKKNVTVNKEETKPAAKAAAKKVSAGAEPVKAEESKAEAPKAEAVKTEEVKAEAPKAEKKPGRKPAVKAAEKKPAEKKPAEKKTAAKKELKSEITLQFGGNSYSQEKLVQIAKDVWKYDLAQKESDLVSIELYVKPEEHMAYYRMNEEFTGSFYL